RRLGPEQGHLGPLREGDVIATGAILQRSVPWRPGIAAHPRGTSRVESDLPGGTDVLYLRPLRPPHGSLAVLQRVVDEGSTRLPLGVEGEDRVVAECDRDEAGELRGGRP